MDSDARPLIVHVVNALQGGGTERILETLLRCAGRRHFRHALVTLRNAGEFCKQLPSDVPVYALEARGASMFTGLRLARVLLRWKPAIVHARGAGCWADTVVATAIAGRIPAILAFHGLETGNGFTANHRRAARWGLRMGATFTSVSRAGIELMKDKLKLPPSSIHHMQNGVDTSRFAPSRPGQRDAARAELGIPPSATVVGTVASLTPIKRHDLMLDALCELRRGGGDARLLIVGHGPLRARIADHARRVGVGERVIFAGHREDVGAVFHTMDAYVCASDSEGVSNSVLEAMAAGVPIVTTNVGDHGILVRDGVEGAVVEARSAAALACGLRRVLSDPADRARMGRSARVRADSMNLGGMLAASYESFYERAAGVRLPRMSQPTLAG